MLAVHQQAEAVLGWWWWRRRHQAAAAWYHSRRRARLLPPAPMRDEAEEAVGQPEEQAAASVAFEQPGKQTEAELLAQLWERLEPLLPPKRRAGRTQVYDRRSIVEAIVYELQTDCGWSELPSRFPPSKTVHALFVSWRTSGIWNQIWQGLTPPRPRRVDQLQL